MAMAFVRVITNPKPGPGGDDAISINAQFGRKSLHSGMVQCLAHLTRCGDHYENREVASSSNSLQKLSHDMDFQTVE